MKYFFVALVSGLVGVAMGYALWGSGGISEDASFRSEPVPTEEARSSETAEMSEVTNSEDQIEDTVTVEASAMSAEQQALLRTFGIDLDGITVTVQMIACAEDALGKERLDTIMRGASPTFFESAELLGCYQQ